MKEWKVFGRITGEKEECRDIIQSFFKQDGILACYERADDGCSRDHTHFIASADFKNLKSLRQSFSEKCFKILGERLRYSIKEYEELKDAEAYICKGHKKDASVKPDIYINTYNNDVEESYNRFHKVQADIKQNQKTICVWKEVNQYIRNKDPTILSGKIKSDTAWKIADFLFDWYLLKGRMIQGKYIQQGIIRTIIANNFKTKTVKGQILSEWVQDFQYGDDLSYLEAKVYKYSDLHDPEDVSS